MWSVSFYVLCYRSLIGTEGRGSIGGIQGFLRAVKTLTVVVVNTCVQGLDHLGGQRRESQNGVRLWQKNLNLDLGGPVVKNPPVNAGDTGSIPGPGRSQMPRCNSAYAPRPLSLALEPVGHTRESPRIAMNEDTAQPDKNLSLLKWVKQPHWLRDGRTGAGLSTWKGVSTEDGRNYAYDPVF